jgi:hypothetical protein
LGIVVYLGCLVEAVFSPRAAIGNDHTLDEIYPEQKPLPALWWWNEKP